MIKLIISEPSSFLKEKIDKYVSSVINERNEFNYNVFDFEVNPLDEIIDSLNTYPFLDDKKVVICKNPYFIKDAKMKLPFENKLEKLDEYLNNPCDFSLLIIICSKKYYNAKSKFIEKIKKIGSVESYLFDKENDLVDYLNDLIIKNNIKITQNAKNLLIQRCLDDVCKLEQEVDKMVLYNNTIDESYVKQMVARPLEDDVFSLTNALMSKNKAEIMKIYTDLKLLKIEPINLIILLASQYRLMLQISILSKQNLNNDEIANKLEVHPYRVKVIKQQLYKYNIEEIKNTLVSLATLDSKIKKGESDRYIDFELFLASK